jgi:hypothetical protein
VKGPTSSVQCRYLEINVDLSKHRDEQEQIVSSILATNVTIPISYRVSSGKLLITKEKVDLVGRLTAVDHFKLDKQSIIRGVDTSPSNYQGKGVFVLTDKEFLTMRSKLTQFEMEFIKPFFSASQINSYHAEMDNYHWLIYTDEKRKNLLETKKDLCPTLVNHLGKYRDVITSDNRPYGLHRPKKESYFTHKNKLVFVRKTQYPKFAFIPFPFFCDESVYFILPQPGAYSQFYFLSALNSTIAHFWFSRHKMQGGQLQIDKEIILSFPVRHIYFVTPKEEKEKLVEEAKNLYKKYLETLKPDTILYFIESRLMKEHKPEGDLLKRYNSDPLNKEWQILEGTLWEQSDVVHDFLAFLAEQMTEMSNEKEGEVKGFLKWLETYLKIQSDTEGNTGIETLTGKAQIKNFLGDYQEGDEHLPFEEFWKIIEKNKSRIQANLSSRKLYENIRSEYEKSLSKLLPLKEILRKTDWLIDQIVYRLYGLTEAEIKIVKGS